jgi:type I restriction enzyme, R subunit
LLYLYQKKYDLRLPYDQIDKIIENVKTVALRRY